MKMAGYNGSQLWDTAFTAQAYVAANVDTAASIESLKKAHTYIKNTQVCQLGSPLNPVSGCKVVGCMLHVQQGRICACPDRCWTAFVSVRQGCSPPVPSIE